MQEKICFRDYSWDKGRPIGRIRCAAKETPISYKIVHDPYYKRICIERYAWGLFQESIYDSCLLDFRSFRQGKEPVAWERQLIQETDKELRFLVKDEEDRVRFLENHTLESGRTVKGEIFSMHGLFLCSHHLFWRDKGDAWNGLQIWDREGRLVLTKNYTLTPNTGDFADLIAEKWGNDENAP